MTPLLSTSGFRVGDILVPAFQVSATKYLGLVILVPYGADWYRLLGYLSGLDGVDGLHLDAQMVKDRAGSTTLDNADLLSLPVPQYLGNQGVAERHHADLL